MGSLKKQLKSMIMKVLVAVFLLVSAGISYLTVSQAASKPMLSKTSISILEGKQYKLNVKGKVAKATFTWSSDNKNVASVTKTGMVTGVSQGNAIITCKIKTSKSTDILTCKVTVTKAKEEIKGVFANPGRTAGYLFVHFTGEGPNGEQVYFSLSKDGIHFEDLNAGKPVLTSTISEMGARDPFPIWSEKDKKYYILATDLRIASGKGWDVAQYSGSRNLIIWESEDLINWSKERSVSIGVEGAGCVWAPEAIYDPRKEEFLVYFASMIKLPGDTKAKQRIYATYTKDFKEFSEPFVYIERGNHVIDTTIVYDGEKYYRFSKDETTKRIIMESSNSLDKDSFTVMKSDELSKMNGVEGPEIYQLPDKSWCLIVDRYATSKGYLPLISNDLSKGEFRALSDKEFNFGKTMKRHGGVLPLSEEEYDRLHKAFPVNK